MILLAHAAWIAVYAATEYGCELVSIYHTYHFQQRRSVMT